MTTANSKRIAKNTFFMYVRMVLKFFVKTDKDGNEINSWYYETWKRVKMPPVYPKDLVR